jgi:hypothetical protein
MHAGTLGREGTQKSAPHHHNHSRHHYHHHDSASTVSYSHAGTAMNPKINLMRYRTNNRQYIYTDGSSVLMGGSKDE